MLSGNPSDDTMEDIIGKYKVIDLNKPKQPSSMLTDNAREAVWEANRRPNRIIENICGEKEFYHDESGWHIKKNT